MLVGSRAVPVTAIKRKIPAPAGNRDPKYLQEKVSNAISENLRL
jgi:hypothetical protein